MKNLKSSLKPLIVISLILIIFNDNMYAGSFDQLSGQIKVWIGGNLGKLIALLGFVFALIVYIMTHKAGSLFAAVVIAVIAGGMSNITDSFFYTGIGKTTYDKADKEANDKTATKIEEAKTKCSDNSGTWHNDSANCTLDTLTDETSCKGYELPTTWSADSGATTGVCYLNL